jgi:hypothetical protein
VAQKAPCLSFTTASMKLCLKLYFKLFYALEKFIYKYSNRATFTMLVVSDYFRESQLEIGEKRLQINNGVDLDEFY